MSTIRSCVVIFLLMTICTIIAKGFNGSCSTHVFRAQIPGYKSIPCILLDVLSRERSTYNRENKVTTFNKYFNPW